MAKFLITFSVLVAIFALSIHARSSSTPEAHTRLPHGRHSTHHRRTHHEPVEPQEQRQEPSPSSSSSPSSPAHQHNKHHQPNRPPPQADVLQYRPEVEANKSDEAMRRYHHIQRHFERQAEHQKQHRDHYKRPARRAEMPDLRSMPRIWQHFQKPGDRMYGDEPMLASDEYDDEAQQLEADLPSLGNWETDEGFANASGDEEREDYDEASSSHDLSDGAAHPKGCPKCESSRKVELLSEEEVTRLRIEFVKQQILEKLRLKERPNVSAVGLPKPIYEGTTIEEADDTEKSKDLDDYYARTSKKFIFLQREKRECKRLGSHPSMCFSFKIDDADADSFDVNTAVLWIFKNKQSTVPRRNSTGLLDDQQTIVVSEVQQQLNSKYLPIVKTIAIQTVDVQDEWMKIDIEWPIKRWFGNRDLSHLIHISCQSCDIKSMDEMISVDKDYRPFIMVDTQNRRRSSRQKRGINCTDGVTECCREKLYISFDEIGWGDWIIHPRGYDAYFCRGSCGSVASVTQSASYHTTFLQKALSSRGKPLELIPCCTAKQYSSLQIVFMDTNNTATQKTFPNMVVESCGCR